MRSPGGMREDGSLRRYVCRVVGRTVVGDSGQDESSVIGTVASLSVRYLSQIVHRTTGRRSWLSERTGGSASEITMLQLQCPNWLSGFHRTSTRQFEGYQRPRPAIPDRVSKTSVVREEFFGLVVDNDNISTSEIDAESFCRCNH